MEFSDKDSYKYLTTLRENVGAIKIDQQFISLLSAVPRQLWENLSVQNFGYADAHNIAIANNLSSEQILQYSLQRQVSHIIQSDALCFEKELLTSVLMLSNPGDFVSNPLKSILFPFHSSAPECNIYQRKFSDLKEKYTILEEVETCVINQCKSNSIIYDIQSVVDELVTNAIFHGNEVENRKEQMNTNQFGELFIGVDESRIVVGCRDPHGKLNIERLFNRILTCYTSEVADKINMGQGGAGIGSFLVHNMSTSYFVAVEKGKQSIICALLPIGMSNRKRLKLPKNLHCLHLEEKS